MRQAHNTGTISWTKRPAPFPDESLSGFLGRWARENVLYTRANLLIAIGVSRAIRVSHSDVGDLAKALNIDYSILESMAPSSNPSRPVLRRSHMRPTIESICPDCLAAASYCRQLWSHALATACPEHERRLLDRCQQCNTDIRHDRQLPHICDCGADFRIQKTAQATSAEIEFSTMLIGNQPNTAALPFDLGSGIPGELDLVVWGMSNHFTNTSQQSKVGKSPLPKTVDQAVAKLIPLFNLMECWPEKFEARLEEMLLITQKGMSTGAAARAGRWYHLLFRKYHHLDAFQPIRVATANAIVKSHDGLLNARTSSVISIATVQKNWYSVKEASAELRVSVDRINDGIDRCLINAQIHDEAVGYRQRFIALCEIKRLQRLQFDHISEAYAQSILQVPDSVFKLMCESGWFDRADKNDVAPVVSGYVKHVSLLALIERLQISAKENNHARDGSTVHLCDLNLRRTTDIQRLIGLFRAIAAGEIVPIGHDEQLTIGKLSFAQKDIDKRIASWFVVRGLSLEQVSDLTGAHYDAVKSWTEMGLLPATKEPLEQGSPWVIELRDLLNFMQTYVPLALQASASKSTTRGITQRLKRMNIDTIASSSGRGAVVRLQDIWDSIRT